MTQLSNLFNTGKGSNYRYCDRGDPSGWDWQKGDFTCDKTWRDLDCSSIVSSDAVAILFRIRVEDDAANQQFYLRENGNSESINLQGVRTQVADIIVEQMLLVSCDSNQIVEYYAANTVWSIIDLVVVGWYIESGTSGGDVLSNADITDNCLIRGDGGAKKVQECSTIKVTDNGEMTNTGQPCFNVVPTSEQSNIAVSGYIDIIFGTERFDVGNNFATNVFTAPVTGKYQLDAVIWLAQVDTGSSFVQVSIATSNRTYYSRRSSLMSGDFTDCHTISVVVDMDINDTAKCQIYISGGAAQVDIDTNSVFSGTLIC